MHAIWEPHCNWVTLGKVLSPAAPLPVYNMELTIPALQPVTRFQWRNTLHGGRWDGRCAYGCTWLFPSLQQDPESCLFLCGPLLWNALYLGLFQEHYHFLLSSWMRVTASACLALERPQPSLRLHLYCVLYFFYFIICIFFRPFPSLYSPSFSHLSSPACFP